MTSISLLGDWRRIIGRMEEPELPCGSTIFLNFRELGWDDGT